MKKAISYMLALAVCLGLTVPAFANAGTTTSGTAYKDLNPRTDIYAVTKTPGSDYIYYGAKNEPRGGVLYGRTDAGGTLPDGSFGMANLASMQAAGESVVSHYYSLNDSYSLEYWSYLFDSALKEGGRALLIYINFENEAGDCDRMVSGAYDSKLIETFRYLNTLSCPVFVRIGGEVNVWGDMPKAADYIAAFRHASALGRHGLLP